MKLTAHLIVSILLLAVVSLNAADPVAPLIEITVDYVQLPAEEASALIHGSEAPATSLAWHETIVKLVKEGKGKAIGSITVSTKSGQRATSESVLEHIYPTAFDAAKGRASESPSVPSGLTAVDLPSAKTFEMRPVGLRLEVDPVLAADASLIDLNIAPEALVHVGDKATTTLPHETGERDLQLMPRFYSMKNTTAVTMRPGGTALCGINTPPNEDGSPNTALRVLCLVTARLVQP